MNVKRNIAIPAIFGLLAFFISGSLVAKDTKLAQTSLKFLSYSYDARAAAMGDAVTAIEGNSSSMFYNPASMSRQENTLDFSFGSTRWIADINYMYGSVSYVPMGGDLGVFGLSFSSVDYGDLIGTIKQGSDGYEETGNYSPTAFSLGLGYAKALSDKFSVGANIKYVKQDLGTGFNALDTKTGVYSKKDYSANVMAFDFGVLYKTGFKSLNFAMDIRNFSKEISFIDETSQLPLSLKIGFSMNLMDLTNLDPNVHKLVVTLDATHPRDYSEQVSVGAEYTFLNTLSLRAGYTTPTDEQGINAGIGLKHDFNGYQLGVDYAYTKFGVFGDIHRFTLSVGL